MVGLFLLVPVLPQTLLALVGGHLVLLSLFTAWHIVFVFARPRFVLPGRELVNKLF
jgi:hypothetical protein